MTPDAEIVQLRTAVEKMQAGLEQLQEDKLLTDRECTRLRRESAALKRMLQDARERDPNADTIRMILAQWKATNSKNDRTNVEAGGTRWERVRSYLKKYPNPQEHIDAIKGQHTSPHKWWVEHSKTEVEHVYKDDAWFEKFRDAGRAERENPTPEPVAPQLGTPEGLRACPVVRVMDALPADNFPSPVDGDHNRWRFNCPAHLDDQLTAWMQRNRKGWVRVGCAVGCEDEAILAVLGLNMDDCWRDAELDAECDDAPLRRRGPSPENLADLRRVQRVLADWDRKVAA